MRHYETLYIINPDLADEDIEAVVGKFRGILEDHGATMIKVDDWGRRRLAYEVKKFHKGYYVLFEYGAGPDAINEMERNFKIDERVIRYLTVLLEEDCDLEALLKEQEPEQPEEAAEETTEAPAEETAEAAEEAPAEEAAEEAPAEEAAEAAEEAKSDDDPEEKE